MDYYNEIKNKLINNEVNKKVKDYSKNKYELQTYYDVGKLLIEAQGGEKRAKYGNGLIKKYSIKLTKELGRGYSITNLKNMRQFYLLFKKSQAVPDQMTWSHIVELLSIKNINEINYYIKVAGEQNLGYRKLREKIKNKEYERLPKSTKNKLINKEEKYEICDFVPNSVIIRNKNNIDVIKEKVLQKIILEDIENFMSQLGNGYCFIGHEYKIKFGNTYNYIDILLYNYMFRCFIVVELKSRELKKEDLGQIGVYMNYIDKNVKSNIDNKTIGLIVVKENNEYIIKYSSDSRIKVTVFELI